MRIFFSRPFVPVLFLLAAAPAAADVVTFADIEFWVGAGANEAAVVIDWADGRDPLARGYRWDGAAFGEDMLRAVAAADARLRVDLAPPDPAFGTFVTAVGYDRDGDGFSPADPADSYEVSGDFVTDFRFWEYFTAPDSPYTAADGAGEWTSASTGISQRVLTDGSWDGLQFGNFPNPGAALAQAAPVPEPATALLVLAACGAAGLLRRRG